MEPKKSSAEARRPASPEYEQAEQLSQDLKTAEVAADLVRRDRLEPRVHVDVKRRQIAHAGSVWDARLKHFFKSFLRLFLAPLPGFAGRGGGGF